MSAVHNHGPTEGRGLACGEAMVDGKLRGHCLGALTVNPWAPRADYRKRIITVSVTAAQDADFENMKATLGLGSDGAVIKEALRRLHEFIVDPASPDSGSV